MQSFIQRQWQTRSIWAWAWSPLSLLVCGLARLKRVMYRMKLLRAYRSSLPVIVVGNLTAGGSGKSPLVIHLVNELAHRGYQPAIITRGYKGKNTQWPVLVNQNSDPREVGDEAVLMAKRTGVHVMAGPNRVASVKKLAKSHCCNVVVSDDGFQHLRLARDINILVMDGQRRYGNRWCLPSGPLREPLSATRDADWVIVNGQPQNEEIAMQMSIREAYRLDGSEIRALTHFKQVHAVAGIGHPERFFSQLEAVGIEIIRHAFPDHHAFVTDDLNFAVQLPILMTEKDAVKCQNMPHHPDCWAVPVMLDVDPGLVDQIVNQINIKHD